jgi:hypothetical protein
MIAKFSVQTVSPALLVSPCAVWWPWAVLSPEEAGEGYHTGLGLRTNDPQANSAAATRMTGNTTSFTVVQP